ncbi:hypothetical protein AAY473_033780 [Plecturocebus cupreus]
MPSPVPSFFQLIHILIIDDVPKIGMELSNYAEHSTSWEAKVGGSPEVQELETILTNMEKLPLY